MSDAAAPAAPAASSRWWRNKATRNALKIVAICFVFYFFILPLIPGFRRALDDLQKVNPALLLLGLSLQLWPWELLDAHPHRCRGTGCRSGACSGSSSPRGRWPASSPAGAPQDRPLGYRLLTLSGVDGPTPASPSPRPASPRPSC